MARSAAQSSTSGSTEDLCVSSHQGLKEPINRGWEMILEPFSGVRCLPWPTHRRSSALGEMLFSVWSSGSAVVEAALPFWQGSYRSVEVSGRGGSVFACFDAAVAHRQYPIGKVEDAAVVGDQHSADAAAMSLFPQQFDDLPGTGVVER